MNSSASRWRKASSASAKSGTPRISWVFGPGTAGILQLARLRERWVLVRKLGRNGHGAVERGPPHAPSRLHLRAGGRRITRHRFAGPVGFTRRGRAAARALPARLLQRTVRRDRRPADSARDETLPAPPPSGDGRSRRPANSPETRELGPVRAGPPAAPPRPPWLGRRRVAVSPPPERHLRLHRRQLRTNHPGGRRRNTERHGSEGGRRRRPSDDRRPPPHARA